jgi:hypothetical protein
MLLFSPILIQIIMPHDLIRALEAATDIAAVLALSGDFNIFMLIARLLYSLLFMNLVFYMVCSSYFPSYFIP